MKDRGSEVIGILSNQIKDARTIDNCNLARMFISSVKTVADALMLSLGHQPGSRSSIVITYDILQSP